MKYTIGELAEIIDGDRGKNYPQQSDFFDSGYCLFLNTGNVTNQGFSFEQNQFITKEKCDILRKGKLQRGDIVYTTRGTVGNAAYYSEAVEYEHIRINSGMVIIRPNNKVVDTRFLYQILKSDYYRPFFKQYCTGSAQPQLPIKNFSKIELVIPTLAVQNRIAEILFAYDDLIGNNQKQIELLEEAAQRLYKEWFIDFRFPGHETTRIVDGIPKGWRKTAINDIAEYINGYAFKPEDWFEKGKPIIKIKEMNEGVTKGTPRNFGTDIPLKYHIVAGDILFSWSATLSAKIWDGEDGLLNQHLFKVVPLDNFGREYVLQSILYTLNEFKNLTTGATMKHIQRGKLKDVFVNVPCQELMDKYSNLAEPIRFKILSLKKVISKATEARDRLLPKLMSGELEA